MIRLLGLLGYVGHVDLVHVVVMASELNQGEREVVPRIKSRRTGDASFPFEELILDHMQVIIFEDSHNLLEIL